MNLLAKWPEKYWNSINPKTIEDVFAAPEVGLATICKELGEIKLKAMMVIWMESFINFYSTTGTMDKFQVADTINLIIDEYPHYTMYDFKLFFKRAKLGDYGEVYGRMDGQVILSWLRKYDIMRDTAAQNDSIKEQEQYKEFGNKPVAKGFFYNEYLKWKEKYGTK